MLKTLLYTLFIVSATGSVWAQGWTTYAGGGVGYDAFLRDKTVTTNKVAWPFQVTACILGGVAYHTASGFNIFSDANWSLLRVQFPVPGIKKSRNFFEQTQLRFMVGSGPRIDIGTKGNFITPFIELGASYVNDFGNSGVGNDDEKVNVIMKDYNYEAHWMAVCGAGIDWQFNAIVPSAINVQLLYTPLNMFPEPLDYTASTTKGTYDLKLQGKVLQFLLSYKVHIWMRHSSK